MNLLTAGGDVVGVARRISVVVGVIAGRQFLHQQTVASAPVSQATARLL